MEIFGGITSLATNFAKFALVTGFLAFVFIYFVFPMVSMFVPYLMMLLPFDALAFVPHFISAIAFMLSLWAIGHLLN